MAQDWEIPTAYGAAQTLTAPAYALRPLSLGELLDRTFSVYRSHFWLFAGIASFSGAVNVLVNAFNLLGHHLILTRAGFQAATLASSFGSILVSLAFLVAASITQAATVHALSAVYLGRMTTVQDSFRAIGGRWYRWVGIALWQGLSATWVMLVVALPGFVMFGFAIASGSVTLRVLAALLLFVAVLGGGAYGVFAYLRNSLGVQSSIIEELPVRLSMRRSKVLAKGTKGRIFVVLLISFALYMVFGVFQGPLIFIMLRKPQDEHIVVQIVIMLIGFLSHTLVSPVALIGLTLVYFDQRVRNEAFDILMLLEPGAGAGGAIEPAAWPPVAPAAWPPTAPVEAAAWPASAGAEPAAWPPPEIGSLRVPAISAEPISAEPILADRGEETLPPKSDDEPMR